MRILVTTAAYGDAAVLPNREASAPQPLSPYAASKLAGEAYCQAFSASFGLVTVMLRYYNVFGPRQDPASAYAAVVPIFISKALKHESPVIYGDGEQTRDFTFVANVVHANLLACEAPAERGLEVSARPAGRPAGGGSSRRRRGAARRSWRPPSAAPARPAAHRSCGRHPPARRSSAASAAHAPRPGRNAPARAPGWTGSGRCRAVRPA